MSAGKKSWRQFYNRKNVQSILSKKLWRFPMGRNNKKLDSLLPSPDHLLQDVIRQEKRVKASICSKLFFAAATKTLALVSFYYVFSIGLTFYNQHMFKHGHLALSITMCHLLFKFWLATIIRQFLECKTKEPRIVLPWPVYLKRVALAGAVGALDIGLSNWSFEMISVSLYTMSKSTAVVFILFFSLVFRLEKFRFSLVVVVLLIFTGLFLFTYHSTQFNLQGFILVMTASVLSGLRWTLAQVLLQKHEMGLHNPIDMMYHIQPWMMLTLLPLSAGIELQVISTSEHYFRFTQWTVLLSTVGYVLVGATLGFMLEFSEFLLLAHTSSLTLSISGIFKEICILGLAILITHDKITLLNGVGLVVCVAGITVHVISKAVVSKEEKEKTVTVESMKMLSKGGEAVDVSDSDEMELFRRGR
ncbi:solute carrier family 35 member C2-like [Physella acuta]|uniref:solute carrier family 35 member C2-like n=1 Tax=Physella acuta TaxID=109671 RepID=UPI0027DBACB8|nr:solute carrier family 35 member C2-like [Physella acuta]XP_059163518.1 solute carrier family 35 member C2-like [Physella acuta]XP_059163519.1 solute carrier family 35 member C2-like [Physella acuta]